MVDMIHKEKKKKKMCIFSICFSIIIFCALGYALDSDSTLLGWYLFDNDSLILQNDNTGNGYDLDCTLDVNKKRLNPIPFYSYYSISTYDEEHCNNSALARQLNGRNYTVNIWLGNATYDGDRTYVSNFNAGFTQGWRIFFSPDSGGRHQYQIKTASGTQNLYWGETPTNSMMSATYDGQTYILYMNGTPEVGYNYTEYPLYNDDGDFCIGERLCADGPLNAQVDDMSIWTRALNQSEIADIFLNGITGAAAPPEEPNVSIISPENNTYFRNYYLNLSFNFNDLDAVNCTGYNNRSGSFEQFDSIADYTNYTSYLNQSGIYLYYRFEEDSPPTIVDETGNYEGTSEGSPLYVDSPEASWSGDNALYLDGYNDLIDSQDNGGFEYDQAFSITFWLNNTFNSSGTIVNKLNGDQGGWFLTLQDGTEGGDPDSPNIVLVFALFGNISTGPDSGALIAAMPYNMTPDSQIYDYITMVYNGSGNAAGVRFWKNAVEQFSIPVFDNFTGTIANDGHLVIGNSLYLPEGAMNGSLDEFAIFNRTLDGTEITNFYNNGLLNYTGSNVTLTEGYNYTFQDIFYADQRDNLTYYVNCYDGESVDSELLFLNVDTDFNGPEITVLFPVEDVYNFDLWINFTTNEICVCSVNNTDFSSVVDNGSFFSFKETLLLNDYYSILLNCTDLSNNYGIYVVNITKDKITPEIEVYSPLNGSEITNNGLLKTIINVTDNRELYNLKINFTYEHFFLGQQVLYTEERNISGTNYIYYENLDTSSWVNETDITMNSRVCDSHTGSILKKHPSITKDRKNIKFTYGKTIIHIKSNNNPMKSDYSEQRDRYVFGYTYDETLAVKTFDVWSNKDIVYLEDSGYKGHFVIPSEELWLDFMQSGDVEVSKVCEEENNETICKFRVSVYNSDDILSFDSIGELNCNNNIITFRFVQEQAVSFLGFVLDMSNTAHVLLVFAFIIFYIGLMTIAFFFKNFGFASFGFIIGIVLGLFLSVVHIFLFLLFTLINVSIFIRYSVSMR